MQLSAPDGDEIEITIFGRGVGECCVLHVGMNRWVVIDTFNHTEKLVDPVTRAKTVVPVARWYLDALGVDQDRIETIVITHFHRDQHGWSSPRR
jgi:glyoxylase-like metal-dependent hydrolase (beta-lactamase superfamily II)